jgi:hypothetical protein
LFCHIRAEDIQWKQGVVIAATIVYFHDTFNILLLSSSLEVYCITLANEHSSNEKIFSSVSSVKTFLTCSNSIL